MFRPSTKAWVKISIFTINRKLERYWLILYIKTYKLNLQKHMKIEQLNTSLGYFFSLHKYRYRFLFVSTKFTFFYFNISGATLRHFIIKTVRKIRKGRVKLHWKYNIKYKWKINVMKILKTNSSLINSKFI